MKASEIKDLSVIIAISYVSYALFMCFIELSFDYLLVTNWSEGGRLAFGCLVAFNLYRSLKRIEE